MRTHHLTAVAVTAGLLGTACVMTGIARAATTTPHSAPPRAASSPVSAPRYLNCPSPARSAAQAPESSRTGGTVTSTNGKVQIRATLTYLPGVAIRLGTSGTPTEEVTNTGTAPDCSLIADGTVWVYDGSNPAGHLVTSLTEKQRLLNATNFAGDPTAWNRGKWYPVSP
jgi:hypothetical protein